MQFENNESFNSFKKYAFILCAAIIAYISFTNYFLALRSVYGIPILIMQALMVYCLLKIFQEINLKTILISALVSAIAFMLINILQSVYFYIVYQEINKLNMFIALSLHFLSGLVMALLGLVAMHKKESNDGIGFAVALSIGIVASAAITQGLMRDWVLLIAFFSIQAICAFYLCNISVNCCLIGNVLIALYFAFNRLFMISRFTDELENAGWAFTYATSLLAGYLILHLGFAITISLTVFLGHRHLQGRSFEKASINEENGKIS